MSAASTDLRLVPNPLRQDGQWVKVARHQKNYTYFGQLWVRTAVPQYKIYTPMRPTPALAAQDTDRIIYKAQGPDAKTNGTLTPALKAQLDTMSLEEVVAQVKSTGGRAFSRGSSAYRGVSWCKRTGRWCAMFRPGVGARRLFKCCDTELEAAQQYDSWCQQYGKPLSEHNFPPAADARDTAPPAATAAAPEPAAGDAAAAVPPPAPPAPTIAAMLAAPAAPPPAAAPAADPRPSAATVAGSASPSAAPAAGDSRRPDWEEWVQGEEGEWWTDSSGSEDDWVEGGEAAAADILHTAWQQLHSSTPMPPETQALLWGSSRRGAGAAQPGMQQQQQEGSLLAAGSGAAVGAQVAGGSNHSDRDSLTPDPPAAAAAATAGADGGLMAAVASAGLPPALAAAAGAASARLVDVLQEACAGRGSLASGTGLQSMFVPQSNGPSSSQPQGEAAATAADGSSTVVPATQLTIELDSCECLSDDSLLTAAALARAAAAITHHPRTISAADRAVATAGGAEPPAAAVSEIESALRTGAAQSVRQLQPGGTHYWRGKKAWAHNQQHTASSSASTAEAAAEAAAKAPDTDAAVTAAIAATEAAGRGCSPQDLHAAWLMQRLDAGMMRVVVQPPVLTTAALQLALADHGVDVIPGIDYEPVPGLHPELDYPDTLTLTHPASPTDKGPSSAADCRAAAAAAAAAKHSTGESDAIKDGGAGQRDPSGAGCSKTAGEAAGGSSKDTTQPTDTSPAAADTATPDEAAPLNPATPGDADPTKQTPAAPAHPRPAPAPDTAAAKSPAAAGGPMDWAAALAAAEEDAADLAAYPYPLPGERRPFDDPSSEEEEPYEAQWVAGLVQGKHPAAAGSGPRPPYGSSTAGSSGAFAASAIAAAAAVLGGAGAGGSVDGGHMWGPAQLRREHRQIMGFNTGDIPTIKVEWTGDEMADTITFLKAVIAEGDADHLPNHVRAYRIGELVKQKDPTFPLDELLAMGRPIEGDYCPVVLGVPPPDPDAPAAAAAAAAVAAAGLHRPADRARVQDSFDSVNRRPAQVLLLPGCSRSGLQAAERRATAAARAAMLPAEEPAAAVGLAAAAATAAAAGLGPEGLSEGDKEARLLAFETVSGAGARQLVQQLRPIKHADASTPGAFGAAAGGQGSSKGGRRILKATRHSGQTATPADIPVALPGAAAAPEAAAPMLTGTAVVSAAAAAAADKLRSLTSCNEGLPPAAVPPCDPCSNAAGSAAAVKAGSSSSGSKAPAVAAAAAAGKLSSRSGRCGSNDRTAAAAAASGDGDQRRSNSCSTFNKDRIRMLQEMQRKARATLAAACSAPVVAAGMPDCAAAAVDDHLSNVHPSLLAAAAEAATEAASAVLQPQPMDVDWTHVEDLAGRQGLWQPAQQQVDAALQAAQQAAKARAAEIVAAGTAAAAAGGAGGDGSGDMQTGSRAGAGAAGKDPTAAAGNIAAAASSSKVAGNSGSNGRGGAFLQQQVGLLMGFIKADSCPAISAAEEAALGMKMPRPLAIVHDYAPDSAAARAAAAAVAALVPGGGLTFGSSDEYPSAGSAGDDARVSYGAAVREQQGIVAELERKVQALRKQQEYEDGLEAAFQSGGFEAAAAFMAAADAERDAADPNAWIDNHPCPTPDLIYIRAGGTGSWPAAPQAVSKYSRDQPAVVAACELGLKICATMTAALERRLDVRDVEQQWAEAVSDTPVVVVFVEDPSSSAAAAAEWEAATERDLSAAIAAVLPLSLPLRARQNALLAYRAASRMQLHLLGRDFPANDVFDNYYEVQLARDADSFWGRVASGKIGQGQDALGVLPHPRVRYYDNDAFWEGLKGQEEEKNRAVDAELRWNEECRIVQEAREGQQAAMTAPGALLHDIVVGAHVPVEGLDRFMLGETGHLIIKTTPLQRMEMFVQELVRRNDSVNLPFWQKLVGDLWEREEARQQQGGASG